MTVFELTIGQEARILDELLEAEKYKNGVMLAQIYITDSGSVVCRVHHIDQEKAEKVRQILSCGDYDDKPGEQQPEVTRGPGA